MVRKQPPSQEEIDRLFEMFKAHIDECPGFEPSDFAALEEVAKIWKAVSVIRKVGGWLWRLTVSVGGFLIKAGAVLTAGLYIYGRLKSLWS